MVKVLSVKLHFVVSVVISLVFNELEVEYLIALNLLFVDIYLQVVVVSFVWFVEQIVRTNVMTVITLVSFMHQSN